MSADQTLREALTALADEPYGGEKWGILRDGSRYIEAAHLHALLAAYPETPQPASGASPECVWIAEWDRYVHGVFDSEEHAQEYVDYRSRTHGIVGMTVTAHRLNEGAFRGADPHPETPKAEPDAGDVETLAQQMREFHDGWTNVHVATEEDRAYAEATLASDWLAAHDAALIEQARAEGEERGRMVTCEAHIARAERAERALAGLVAKMEALVAPGVEPVSGESLPDWVHVDEIRALISEAGQ